MPSLKPINYKKFDKLLIYVGCKFIRQKGSHRIYQRVDLKRPLVIPARKEIPVFIILNNLRLLNISKEKYLEIVDQL